MIDFGVIDAPQFDYVNKSNPTIDVNPRRLYATWLNLTTGELFICTDNTVGVNRWQGQNGSLVAYTVFPSPDISFSFNALSTTPRGITFDGTDLWHIDNITNLIYHYDGLTAGSLGSFDTPSGAGISLTYDSHGGRLISADYIGDDIYIHNGLVEATIATFPTPGPNLLGLAYDSVERNLISADATEDLIYVHLGTTSSIVTTFPAPAGVAALTFDGHNLISCSSARIYVHDGMSEDILTDFPAPAVGCCGLAFTGERLISADNGTDMIYVHKREDEI